MPLQHFDMVELSHVIGFVGVEGTDTRADIHRRGTINLNVIDTETTRNELRQAVVGVLTVMPGVRRMASDRSTMRRSCRTCWVMTDTDCGVSLRLVGVFEPALTSPVV